MRVSATLRISVESSPSLISSHTSEHQSINVTNEQQEQLCVQQSRHSNSNNHKMIPTLDVPDEHEPARATTEPSRTAGAAGARNSSLLLHERLVGEEQPKCKHNDANANENENGEQERRQLLPSAKQPKQQCTANNLRLIPIQQRPEFVVPSATIGATNPAPVATLVGAHLLEKSIIIHKDERGFGLRIRGQAPVCVEHVHVGGAAWRAGVRRNDAISRVNGVPIGHLDHKSVVLILKSCARFAALTLLCPLDKSFSQTLRRATQPAQQAQQLFGADARRPFLVSASGAFFAGADDSASEEVGQSVEDDDEDDYNEEGILRGSADSHDDRRSRAQRPANNELQVCISCRGALERTNSRFDRVGGAGSGGGTCARCQLQAAALGAAHRLRNPLLHGGSLRELQQCSSASRGGFKAGGAHNKRLATFSSASSPNQSTNSLKVGQLNEFGRQQQGGPAAKVNKRLEIIRELLDTERAHTERLRCLDEFFYKPLKEEKLMTSEQLKSVFACHRKLYKLHKQIYRTLLSATTAPSASMTTSSCLVAAAAAAAASSDGDSGATGPESPLMCSARAAPASPLIGSALIEIFEGELKRELEKVACAFCAAQATNAELLAKLTRRDCKVGDFLAQVTNQRLVLGRLGIKDLLASCFQRLTKYPLLLENLLKATPSEAPPELEDDQDLFASLEREPESYVDYALARRLASSGGGGGGGGSEDDDDDDDGELADKNRHLQVSGRARCESASEDERNEEDGEEDGGGDGDGDDDDKASRTRARACCEQLAKRRQLVALQAARQQRRRNSRRMLAISLAEERELIERSLRESRAILVKVNEAVRVALARQKFKEIWRKTDRAANLPPIENASRQQVIHEGALTLRLSKRSFEVHMVLLSEYIIILTRDGRESDKFRLRYFTPESKTLSSAVAAAAAAAGTSNSGALQASLASGASSSGGGGGAAASLGGAESFSLGAGVNSGHNQQQQQQQQPMSCLTAAAFAATSLATSSQVYSPIFHIDEHLTTRDAATDENGFYLLCKRRDDSRIYEFAARSPAERLKWRELIQWTIERQIDRSQRRASCESTLTRSSLASSADSASTIMPSYKQQQQQPYLAQPQQKGATNAARRRTGSGPSNAAAAAAASERGQLEQPTRRLPAVNDNNKLQQLSANASAPAQAGDNANSGRGVSRPATPSSGEPTKIVGTISYVIDDEIVMPSKMESSRVFVDQAIQVNILDGTSASQRANAASNAQAITK